RPRVPASPSKDRCHPRHRAMAGETPALPGKTIAPRKRTSAARSASDQSPRSEDGVVSLAERNLVVVALQRAVRLVEEEAGADHDRPLVIATATSRAPVGRDEGAERCAFPAVLESAIEQPFVGADVAPGHKAGQLGIRF